MSEVRHPARAHRLATIAATLVVLIGVSAPALAQEIPTSIPEAETEAPGWLEPLAPLAALPVWVQAVVLAVVLAAAGFLLYVVIRSLFGSAAKRRSYRSAR
jgi:hypothetical protein